MTISRSDGRARALLSASLAGALSVAACSDQGAGNGEPDLGPRKLPTTNEGIPFVVPGDPSSYRLLRWSRLPNGRIEAIQRQDTHYAIIISRMEIDCSTRRFRVLTEGEAGAEVNWEPKELDEPKPGSIRDATVTVACREALKR